ncbi:TIGR00266 family protein [Clostridiaceae bacterium 14S0207]|nr:TIGR00266 family protein [Clostridiaceae bacterium 14S0207]
MIKHELLFAEANRTLKLICEEGDVVNVEAGAMVSMSNCFELKTKAGGIGKVFGRMLTGESAFIQKFTSKGNGELLLAPSYMGDIKHISLDGSKSYRLGKGVFLASSDGIEILTKGAGAKGFLSGEGLFQMQASGEGELFLSAYGSIYEKHLEMGESYIVDSDHLVLWDSNLKYSVELASGFISSITGGEGLVCQFTGPGLVWIQTRNPSTLTTSSK